MRNAIVGVASSLLLSGALGFSASTGQDPPTTAPAQGTQAEGGTGQRAPTASLTITPDAVDCSTFTTSSKCTGTIVIRPAQGTSGRSFRLAALLTSLEGKPVGITLEAECATCRGDTIALGDDPAFAVQFTITLPDDWRGGLRPQVGTGVIGLVSDKKVFEGTPRRLRVLAASPSGWQSLVVLVPGVLALLVALVVAARLAGRKVGLSHRMGSPSWKASESWSSNLTVGAGLVNSVLALTVITDLTVYMAKPAYAVVGMLFTAFVLLAPLVYGISRRKVEVTATTPPVAPEAFEGSVLVFLAAGTLTLWASGGQLMTFALLMAELWRAGAVDASTAVVIVALVLGVLVALFSYGGSSMLEMASKAKGKPEMSTATATEPSRERRTQGESAPAWSLL
jgi:hypothetical protein